MPTAQGIFTWTAPNQATAQFYVDGKISTCTMGLNGVLPNSGMTSATLNYDNIDQLSGTRSLDGHIGRGDFETDFENAPKIQGDLDRPIDQYISVYGNGRWTQSSSD
ncbi:hypothetical protein ASPFODRAFT_43036 [Aspergillus luchuensis CBS 106.47]|uniref:Uncharacterized protein n=1 Tax=Aspergillus luchuensis (strain CBS 106.47) TaxID=1137211 RepID=A0A1M3TSN7_ASPLC|nr:hypothetical protein ASPFODRAFT_43036 [Aspergillus luchuensis CBS 106.47]